MGAAPRLAARLVFALLLRAFPRPGAPTAAFRDPLLRALTWTGLFFCLARPVDQRSSLGTSSTILEEKSTAAPGKKRAAVTLPGDKKKKVGLNLALNELHNYAGGGTYVAELRRALLLVPTDFVDQHTKWSTFLLPHGIHHEILPAPSSGMRIAVKTYL